MANVVYKYGTEAQILALVPTDTAWVERAFYYPEDKDYFYQAKDGVMRIYGSGQGSSLGVKLNNSTFAGVKTYIETGDVLEIPENYDYNSFGIKIDGNINNSGQINIM